MKSVSVLEMILVVVASAAMGCGHMSYNYGEMHTNAYDIGEVRDGRPRAGGINTRYHEIMVLDNTGITAAAVATTMEREGSAAEAEREARKKTVDGRLRGPVEFEYKAHSANEYAGASFGIYYRWDDAQTLAYDGQLPAKRGDASDPSYGEFGLVMQGEEVYWPDYGLGMAMGFRFYGGMISGNQEKTGSGNIYFALPIQAGLYFAPWWTFGVYAKAEVGLELMTALGNYKYGLGDKDGWRPWEYVLETGYKIDFNEWASAGANVTWTHRNALWGDYWLEFEDFQGGVSFGIDYLTLFK